MHALLDAMSQPEEAREDLSGFSAMNDLLNLTRSNAANRERELLEEIEQLRAQLSQAKDQRDRAEAREQVMAQEILRWKHAVQMADRRHNQ